MFRQGDVLLVKVDQLPNNPSRVSHCVVAEGEVTGHSHRIETGAHQYVTATGEQFVQVFMPRVELRHEEHGTIELQGPAVYRVLHQREFQPEAIQTRSLIDPLDSDELEMPLWVRPAARQLQGLMKTWHGFVERQRSRTDPFLGRIYERRDRDARQQEEERAARQRELDRQSRAVED